MNTLQEVQKAAYKEYERMNNLNIHEKLKEFGDIEKYFDTLKVLFDLWIDGYPRILRKYL